MSLQPPATQPGLSPAPDDMDTLLANYFRAALPSQWPAAPGPYAEPVSPVASRSARQSRWVLAVSVALLAGTCWYASHGLAPVPPGEPTPLARQKSPLDPVTAGDGPILDEMQKHRTVPGTHAPRP